MHRDLEVLLRERGIQPTSQRVAVARYVLQTDEHPSADQVFAKVKPTLPILSRATVYNTLNLFVKQGLLRELIIAEGKTVFDPNVERHHHFIEEDSGRIHDVPWSAVKVKNVEGLPGFEVHDYQVVMRGKRRADPTSRGQ
jgi:Fur family transcriptional regulator, iron response regulator